MSQDAQGTPTIPTKKPTNISTLKSIPLLKDINMNSGSPYNDGQDKLPEYSKYILTRKQSVIDEKKSDIYQNLGKNKKKVGKFSLDKNKDDDNEKDKKNKKKCC